MDKFLIISVLTMTVLLIAAGGVYVYSAPAGVDRYTSDNAISTARQFVTNENTYRYDGMSDSLSVSLKGNPASSRYEILAEYKSRSAGYGDRSDMMTAQVLTPHQAVITVDQGRVVSAVMDGRWDMVAQAMVQGKTSAPKMTTSSDDLTPQ
ncbi:MAG TPA: hypothetical protein VK436_10955 [Methanocella sp.]|nr:hypothetical protein [Methanocella sp.]